MSDTRKKETPTAIAPSNLLRCEGWDACMDSRLLRSTDAWENSREARSHFHVFRRLFRELKIDALLCVENRPTVCVKDARGLTPQEVETLRHRLWNLNATTLLLIEEQSAIKVFSTLKKPGKADPTGEAAQLPIGTLQATELALRLRQFVRRVETGAIYHEYKSLFVQTGAVDQFLLKNLRGTRDKLCPSDSESLDPKIKEKSKKEHHRAHALIGRFLFTCYLFDRKIIDGNYLAKKRLPKANDMLDFLRKSSQHKQEQILARLFDALQYDFNGSLFDNTLDTSSIKQAEVDLLLRFLEGEDITTGQQTLFKLYDFSFIPVELISSIYEEFLGTEATFDNPKKSSNKQRTEGAYYTPPRLAELTIDIATQGWNTLLDKRCFDPACGSGIFLVILFIRMAEEWQKRNPDADTQKRYDAMLQILADNIHGSDINNTACLISCFSLYLAFLDQMDPRAITELQKKLEEKGTGKVLPKILWKKDDPAPKGAHLATIREADFFNLPNEQRYDLVIGNPPWVSRKKAEAASANIESWLMDTTNPYFNKDAEHQDETFFPAGEFACAFMWKSALHVKPEGRICQILPSRVFIANQTNRFQETWLQHHRIETAWLLADWRFILFPAAICPCFITCYHLRKENEELSEFEFITPKVENVDPREALIPVLPDDQKTLWQSDIIEAAKKDEAAYAWKKNHWGTPRDVRLLDRLMRMPRLNSIAKDPPDKEIPDAQRNHFWYKGKGFQPPSASAKKLKPVFWKKTDLFVNAKIDEDLILLCQDTEKIGEKFSEGLRRSPNPLLFKAPLVLINDGCTKFLYSDFDVLFRHSFQSICAPKTEENELLFLTAYLASPLAQYLLFHTTASLGIERDRALLDEILALPFPLPEHTPDQQQSQKIIDECAKTMRTLRKQLSLDANLLKRESLVEEAKTSLTEAVYKYFDICQWERELIEDTVDMFYPSSTPTSLDSEGLITTKKSELPQRTKYAQTLERVFRAWARNTKKQISTQGLVAEKSRLAVITLIVDDNKRTYAESEADAEVENLLKRIRDGVTLDANTMFQPLRGFTFYDGNRIHLLKPIARRHWTRTAALNDAVSILSDMMEENGWK